MASETQNAPPNQTSLLLLRRTVKGLTWLTVGSTLIAIIMYGVNVLTSKNYQPSLITFLGSVCAMITFGGITALCFMALSKIIEIWAEILDSGHYKTTLLEALLTDPVDQEG